MPHFGGSIRVAGVALGVSALMGVVGAAAAGAEVFDDTGAAQEYTVPPDVCEVTVDAYGAQGGSAPFVEQEGTNPGGAGGRLQARVQVTPGERLGVYVGQQGVPGSGQNNDPGGAGGFNGGGAGGAGENGHPGAGGGGASDVRQQPGGSGCPPCAAPTPPHGPGSTLDERVVVAGGGGGAGGQDESGAGAGGAGGGESGGTPDGDGQVSDEGLDGGTAGAGGGAGGANGQPGGAGAPGQGGFGGTDTSTATT
jgi:hypothetical protein